MVRPSRSNIHLERLIAIAKDLVGAVTDDVGARVPARDLHEAIRIRHRQPSQNQLISTVLNRYVVDFAPFRVLFTALLPARALSWSYGFSKSISASPRATTRRRPERQPD
jgi:hypothetical protein